MQNTVANSKYLLFIFLALLGVGCSPTTLEPAEFGQWVKNEENGLIKEKSVDGLKMTLKYVPRDYLLLQDLKGTTFYSQKDVDSLKASYAHSHTFLLNLAPDHETREIPQGASVMTKDIHNFEEYKLRSLMLNFDMNELISIKTEGGEFFPAGAEMENTYDLTQDRNIYLVFSESEKEELLENETWDFTFDDQIFGTGINHFKFNVSDIKAIPEVHIQPSAER